jgi:hypothetical protein
MSQTEYPHQRMMTTAAVIATAETAMLAEKAALEGVALVLDSAGEVPLPGSNAGDGATEEKSGGSDTRISGGGGGGEKRKGGDDGDRTGTVVVQASKLVNVMRASSSTRELLAISTCLLMATSTQYLNIAGPTCIHGVGMEKQVATRLE